MPNRRILLALAVLAFAGPAAAQSEQALAEQRAKIDALDARIVALLNERAKVVREVGRTKQQAGLPVANPKRAEEVLQRITSKNPGPLGNEYLRRIYERIIAEMTAFETADVQKR